MMLSYLGLTVSYDQLLKLLRIESDLGAPLSNIRNLEHLGVTVSYQQGTLADLQQYLTNNRPCLVPVQTSELPYWAEPSYHAVVVTGFDEQQVYVNDPVFANAPIKVSVGNFGLAWLERDEFYATLVVRP
jgi:ABC-type bacteriocin/lantibiotic exporter with double-glycine peptidase domain